MKAAELLAKAKKEYQQAFAHWRDALVEVGKTLHEFVLARLKEGDAFGICKRHRMKITREVIIREAAAELGANERKVRTLLWAWQVVRLLGKGSPGNVPFDGIVRFRLLVRRMKPADGVHHLKGEASLGEQYRIRPGFEESGPELFRRASAESWRGDDCQREVRKILRSKGVPEAPQKGKTGKRKKGHNPTAGQHSRQACAEAVKHAAPGDVAEMCMELVKASADPWQVAQRLIPELQRIKKSRPAFCA